MKRRELKGAVVVLTGASSGIGRAAALLFATRETLAQIAIERFGRIDVWVNDAAVYMLGTIAECPTRAMKDLLVPWLFERVQRALVEADHLGPAGAARSGGNLAGPRGPHAVDGGWKAKRSPGTKLVAGARTAALPVVTTGG